LFDSFETNNSAFLSVAKVLDGNIKKKKNKDFKIFLSIGFF